MDTTNEPVAWMLTLPDGTHDWILDGNGCEGYVPLYTHPSEHDLGIAEAIGFDKGYKAATAKTLTAEEIKTIDKLVDLCWGFSVSGVYFHEFQENVETIEKVDAILKKASEK